MPSFLARLVLQQYYRISYKNSNNRPKDGSTQHKRNYQVVYALVTCSYFVYCILNSIYSKPANYYEIIGVHREEIDSRLKSHFRHIVINLHPDKSPNADPAKFLQIKQIYEVLNNEPPRFIYDCYGDDIYKTVESSSAKSNSKSSIRDFLQQSLLESIAFYIGTSFLFAVSLLWGNQKAIFWRFTALCAFVSLELFILMRPVRFGAASPSSNLLVSFVLRYWNSFATFEKIKILRQIYMYGSMAMSQLSSLFIELDEHILCREISKRLKDLSDQVVHQEAEYQLKSVLNIAKKEEAIKGIIVHSTSKLAADLRQATGV